MPTLPALRRQYSDLPSEVRSHLSSLEALLRDGHLSLALAYLFMKIEQGRYRSMKCIFVRQLKCQTAVVDELLMERAFSRKSFRTAIKSLIGVDLTKGDYQSLQRAEGVRDVIFHGRNTSADRMREAISECMAFVSAFGTKVNEETGKNPFGDLRGLTSRIRPVTRAQSIWIVRGVLDVSGVDRLQK